MDLTSENMYDTFRDEIWKELGPLDPDWFDVLTSQMFTNDGNISDQDDLCANQEGNFKTPFDKTAVDSQLFSTPRVFRHSRAVSPEPEDDQSFTNELEKETLPWTATQSPYLFGMSKEGIPGARYGDQDSFDLLHTPQKAPVSYAKQISESLGAQINPDISWTSSLNTPPAVPSTLILSKTDESLCPVSAPADKNVVFVRKLFPSLSNASRIGALSPKNTDMPGFHQDGVSSEANHNPEPHDSPQSSLKQSEGVWRQKLPDAMKDGEIRSTVASVLDGAENVLSIFFTNSSSALRKVKTERNKRKQIIPTKEYGCSAEDISETNNAVSSEQRTDDQKTFKCSSSPVGNTGFTGTSQWSPLSLSEIPPCTVDTSCPDNNPTAQLENKISTQCDTDSDQVLKGPLTVTQSGLTKKKRKFIYTVHTQEKKMQSQKENSSQKNTDFGCKVRVEVKLEKPQDEADNCSIGKNEMQTKENVAEGSLPPSPQAKVYDFDMSQLCRDFADDFSQISDLGKMSKVAEDPPRNNFSPSACLSAMKQAKQKASQANLHLNFDGISSRCVSDTNPNSSVNRDTIKDSGFQSTVGDTSHLTITSFDLPCSEKNGQRQAAFKAAPVLSANKGNGNAHLDATLHETNAKLYSEFKENQTVDPGTESELEKERMSTQLPSSAKRDYDNINCILQSDQFEGSLPERNIDSLPSIHASGFKTASNKGIQISSANLERAKRLFQENEAEQTVSDQPTRSATKDEMCLSQGSVKNKTSSLNQLQSLGGKCGSVTSQLTASQKADVTDLCTLMEEADSQFEFTQFRTAQRKLHCQDKLQSNVKELDPNFFTGIDFDDSFYSDAEKHMEINVMPDKSTSTNCETLKGLKSTEETILRVSKKCLSKARDALFADVEQNQKSPYEQSSENDAKTAGGQITGIAATTLKNINMDVAKCQIGFQMTSRNTISVSAKDGKEVDCSFKNGIILDRNICMSVNDKSSIISFALDVEHKKKLPKFKNPKQVKCDLSQDPIREFERVCSEPDSHNSHLVQTNVKIHSLGIKNTPALTNAVYVHEDQSLTVKAQDVSASAISELNSDSEFSTAKEKKVFVSVDSAKKADGVLNEIHTLGVDIQLKGKGDALRTGCLTNQIQLAQSKNGGFQTASGRGVVISSAALKKAKSLLSEFDAVEDAVCVKPSHTGPPHGNRGFLAASGKPVALSAEALQKAKALFSDMSFGVNIPAVSDTSNRDKKQNDAEKIQCGFMTAGGATVHVSQENLLKAKKHFKEMENGSISAEQANTNVDPGFRHADPNPGGGFCTASGKKVSVSDDAMTKAKCLLKESVVFENANKKDAMQPQSSGFQTASGKGVAISSAALKKAKALLSECEEVDGKTGVKPARSKMSVCDPPPKEMHCGFITAGGAKVHVLQQNLFKEFADGYCHDSNSHSTNPHDVPKSDLAKLKDVKRTSNLNFTNTRDTDMPTKESAPLVLPSIPPMQETDPHIEDTAPTDAFKCEEGKITSLVVDNWQDKPVEEMPSVVSYEVSQASLSQENTLKRTEESSFLIFQSVDLSSCTETQQRFLAQEALDCTKALLQDEGLADHSPSVTLQNVPLKMNPKSSKRSEEAQKGGGKRPVQDVDMTGQPPIKRRLLEEFDRTVGGPRGSTLHPEKGCPTGVMNDRSVFKYRDSLHPNITKPHTSGNNYVETSSQKTIPTHRLTPGDARTTRSKMPVFVPPFRKTTKTQALKNTVLNDKIRKPAFIPPFKKQRTILQESSSKTHEEDLHHCPFITTSSDASTTQSTKDLPESKSTDSIQILALADTTNDDMRTNQILPIAGGLEDFVAAAQGAKDTISKDPDMFHNVENVELARDMQDMRIRKKKRQTIRPLPGSLFLTKTPGVLRISLKVAVNGRLPTRCTQKQLYGYGVQHHVSDITSETAEDFCFNLQRFFKREAFLDCGGIQLADGGWLITRNDGTAGKEEFYRALCDTPGVDPKLISKEWVYNHYRWIVWKRASMERSFPETMGSLCLTPEQVLLQLKYRYDVEVDHSRRPALRKIVERDDTPAKTLVLCVCGVVSGGQSPNRKTCSDTRTPQALDAKAENHSAVVWLTDGWYAIKAQLDEPLTSMLHKGRLAVGGKLIIHGAQLVGSQDACSPLEAPESLMLKICANSSRPARWDTKLGFYRDPRPFLLPVSSLYSNGGPVGCVDIIILRSYPIQWMERKSDGGVVFRSVRAEEREARLYNSHKEKAMETLFAKIQAEFEREEKGNLKPQRRRRTISHQEVAILQDGEELYEAVGDDPAYLEAHLSEKQLEALHTYRRSLMEKKQAELQKQYCRALESESNEGICPKRDVTPVWRLCFADSTEQPVHIYQLNLWRPSSDLQSLLKEGSRYKVFNLTTSDGKKRSGFETIQFTATKRTQFQDLPTSQEWLSAHFHPRVSTSFVDLQNTEFQPLCGEVDLTGSVISIIDGQGSSPAFYLVDEKLNFVKVRCFSSLSQSGLKDLVKSRELLALSNLQLRGQSTSPTPVVYAGDVTVFSTNPKEGHLRESLSQLRNHVQSHENFYQVAEEKLSHLIKSEGLSSISCPALQTRTPASTTDRRQETKTSIISQQPFRNIGSFTPVSRNSPALSSMEKDPGSLKRRRALDYLSAIPSPPGLSYLSSVASPLLKKTFNPPRRSGTPSIQKSVQTPACFSSPVEDEWVNDEELAMIDTQALCVDDVNR